MELFRLATGHGKENLKVRQPARHYFFLIALHSGGWRVYTKQFCTSSPDDQDRGKDEGRTKMCERRMGNGHGEVSLETDREGGRDKARQTETPGKREGDGGSGCVSRGQGDILGPLRAANNSQRRMKRRTPGEKVSRHSERMRTAGHG